MRAGPVKSFSSKRLVLAAIAIGVGALVVVTMIVRGTRPGGSPATGGDPVSSKSQRAGPKASPIAKPLKSDMALEVEALSLQEIYDQLPENTGEAGLKLMSGSRTGEQLIGTWANFNGGRALEFDPEAQERIRLLFRRLGQLEGERALDYLLEHYGEEEPVTALAMIFAVVGWLEVDPAAALAAFQELSRSELPNIPSMRWKERKVLTGFGGTLRPAAVQFGIREVMRAVSLADRERGLRALGEFPWNHYASFHSGLTGFAQANVEAPTRTLHEMRETFASLVEERHLSRVDGREPSQDFRSIHLEQIERMLAQTWARRDLDAAIDWYAHDLEWDRTSATETDRILTVFGGLGAAQRSEVLRWIVGNLRADDWDDRVIISYTLGWAMGPVDDFVERLAALPAEERDRVEIVERWTMTDNKDGLSLPRVSREETHRLIDAANLSTAARTRLLEDYDTATRNSGRLWEARGAGF